MIVDSFCMFFVAEKSTCLVIRFWQNSAQKMFAGMAPHSDELSEFRSGDEVSKRWEYIRTLDYVQTR